MGTDQTPAPRPSRQHARHFDLLTSSDLAAAFGVDIKTAVRYANSGLLPEGAVFRTPGGHRRFRRTVLEQHWPGMFPPPAVTAGGAEIYEPAPDDMRLWQREPHLYLNVHDDVWFVFDLTAPSATLAESAQAMRRLSVLANQAAEELETAAGAP